MKRLLLTPCSAKKADLAAPARELYRGRGHRRAAELVAGTADLDWFILSARHGLVRSDFVLEPYDEKVTPDWSLAPTVRSELDGLLPSYSEVLVALPELYFSAVQPYAWPPHCVFFVVGQGFRPGTTYRTPAGGQAHNLVGAVDLVGKYLAGELRRELPKVTGSYIQVPLGELSPNPNNPKLDLTDGVAKAEYAKLLRSLTNLGLYAPLLVAQHPAPGGGFYVVNGNHRLRALRELGWEDGTFVECRNLGKLTPAEALAFVVAEEDVKIPLDRIELDLQLKALAEADGLDSLAALVPYEPEELESRIAALDAWSSRDLVQVPVLTAPDPETPDPQREAEGKPYLTLYPDELEYLQKNFKRMSGKFVLNGSKVVAALKGETRGKK